MKHDNINSPAHYAAGKVEVIEGIEAWGFSSGFNRGNAIKYIARAGKKDAGKEIEDLEKAAWYLRREIELLKAAEDERAPCRPNDMLTTTGLYAVPCKLVELEIGGIAFVPKTDMPPTFPVDSYEGQTVTFWYFK